MRHQTFPSVTPAGPALAPEELAGMMAALDRFTDSEIPVPSGSSAAELRAFYVGWRSELTA
jgi:hypothetical protein